MSVTSLAKQAFSEGGFSYASSSGSAVTPPSGVSHFSHIIAFGGDADVTAYSVKAASGDALPATFTLKDGFDLPLQFTSVTVGTASAGGLICVHAVGD